MPTVGATVRFERESLPKSPTAQARGLRRRMTWSEKVLWRELRKLDANFRRQAPIGPYFADFAIHGRKLVIEVDGGVHERLDEVALRDAERQHWLEGEGYTVLRFTDRQVENDVQRCIETIKSALSRRAGSSVGSERAPASISALHLDSLRTPPSPALPPSRRKGE